MPQTKQTHTAKQTKQFSGEKANGDQNGLALTNVNFKNLSETMGFRGRQNHYDAFQDGRCEKGGRIQRKSDENETRRAEKSAILSRCGRPTEAGEIQGNCLKNGWSTDLKS